VDSQKEKNISLLDIKKVKKPKSNRSRRGSIARSKIPKILIQDS
jgi:hypothetical protein